jgi:type VI secretion system protein ImpM
MSGEALTSSDPQLGLFGKIPCRGDFVRRRLPETFVGPWDAWLRIGLVGTRDSLAEAWLDVYLTSPIWRFALTPGVCGDAVVAGVLMPSVDSVNRHYPLTIATLLAPGANPFVVAKAADWFDQLETLALSCLAEGLNFDTLDTLLTAVGMPDDLVNIRPDPAADVGSGDGAAHRIRCAIDWEQGGLSDAGVLANILNQLAERTFGHYSLWWTLGSDNVAPCFLVHDGLPAGEAFSAFLCDDHPPVPASLLPTPSDPEAFDERVDPDEKSGDG